MLNSAVPLVFTGLGIAVAFKSSVFNLGGEGQVYAGGLAAAAVCLALPGANGFLGALAAVAGGLAVSAVVAGLSGWFRMQWDADEMISSFLLSAAVVLVVNWFITGPLDDPANNLLATLPIGPQYALAKIFPPSKLNISAFFSLATAALVWLFMNRTHAGYEMRMCGLNREFARYGGINVRTYLVLPDGPERRPARPRRRPSRCSAPTGRPSRASRAAWGGTASRWPSSRGTTRSAVVPAALLFAWLDAGARAAMLHGDVTYEIAAIAQSCIFFLVTAQALYGLARKRRAA